MDLKHFILILSLYHGYGAIYNPTLVPVFTDEQFVEKSQLLANATFYLNHAYQWINSRGRYGFTYYDLPTLHAIGTMMEEFCDDLIENSELDYEAAFAAVLASEKIIRYIDYMVPDRLKTLRVGRDLERLRRDHWWDSLIPDILSHHDANPTTTVTPNTPSTPTSTAGATSTTGTTADANTSTTNLVSSTTTSSSSNSPLSTATVVSESSTTSAVPSTTNGPSTSTDSSTSVSSSTEINSSTISTSPTTASPSTTPITADSAVTTATANPSTSSATSTNPTTLSTTYSINTTTNNESTTPPTTPPPTTATPPPTSATTPPTSATPTSTAAPTTASPTTPPTTSSTTESTTVTTETTVSTTPDKEIVDPDVPDETGDEKIKADGYWLDLYKTEKNRRKILQQLANKAKKFIADVYELKEQAENARKTLREERQLKPLIGAMKDVGDKLRQSLLWTLKYYNDYHFFSTMMNSNFLPRRSESISGMRVKLIGARHNLPNLQTGSFYPVHFTQKIIFKDEDTRCTNTTDNYDICPISYLKQHRLLTFQISRDMKGFSQFAKGERVRLDGLAVLMRGVDSHGNVTVEVMNVGSFKDYYDGDTYPFYGGPVKAEAVFNPEQNSHQVPHGMKDEDNRYRPVTTPYTKWIVAVDFEKTVDEQLDLSELKALEIHFRGSANYQFVKENNLI